MDEKFVVLVCPMSGILRLLQYDDDVCPPLGKLFWQKLIYPN